MEYVFVSDLIGLTWCPQGSFMLLKVVRFCPFWRLNDTPLCEYGNFLAHSCTDGRAGHFHVCLHVCLAIAEHAAKTWGVGGGSHDLAVGWTPSSGVVGAHGISSLPFLEESLTHCLHSSASSAQDFPLLHVLASIYGLSFWSYPFWQAREDTPSWHFTFTE